MITITINQINLLREADIRLFSKRVCNHIFHNFAFYIEGRDVNNIVSGSINRAMSYNINAENDIIRYVEFDVMIGAPFEKGPGCQDIEQILRNNELSGGKKIYMISQYLLFSDKG
ncbi:MAG: hypothetical protein WCF85_06245 [Rhodospirillaceae bacterium]